MGYRFRTLWSLKEAYVKARGDGLGFPLGQAVFAWDDVDSPQKEDDRHGGHGHGHHLGRDNDNTGTSSVIAADPYLVVNGQRDRRWLFELTELPKGHIVSVAKGPTAACVDAWGGLKATWGNPAWSPIDRSSVAEEVEWKVAGEEERSRGPPVTPRRLAGPAFVVWTVGDLVPREAQSAYAAAGGELLL